MKSILKSESGDVTILILWILVFFVLFLLGVSYFLLYEVIALPLESISEIVAADYIDGSAGYDTTHLNDQVLVYWKYAHLMIAVGIILYAFLRSTRKEEQTFRY